MKSNSVKIMTVALLCALFASPARAEEYGASGDFLTRGGKKFIVKGVVYVPVYPGDLPWELARQKEISPALQQRIRRDLADIKAMGANTVRFWDVPAFCYQALKETGGLALIQTVWFDSRQKDLQNEAYKGKCKRAVRETVDKIYSVYSAAEPPPVLAFLTGSELSRPSVEDTDAAHPEIDHYDGKFVSAPKGSTATACFLAEMADYLKSYEHEKYGRASLVSYANEVRTYDVLDTPFLDFRSFNVYSYAISEFASPSDGSHTATLYQGWLEELKLRHPEVPLLVTETGLSISPAAEHYGRPDYGYGGNTPEEQAEGLAQNWEDIATAVPPVAGGVIHEYLDAWWKFGKHDSLEHNEDDVEEWFGLASIRKEGEEYVTDFRPAYEKLKQIWRE